MITPRDLPPATALWKARERAISLPSNYTTTRDATHTRCDSCQSDLLNWSILRALLLLKNAPQVAHRIFDANSKVLMILFRSQGG